MNVSAVNGFKWSLIDKIFNQGFLFIVIMYLAGVLGPKDFGLIGMLNIFVVLSDNLVKNGFSQALIQRSHRLTEEECSTTFIINILIGIILYALLYLISPFISDFFKEEKLLLASRYLFLIIIITSFSTVARAKLTIKMDFRSQAIANSVAILLSSIVAVILAKLGYSYWSVITLILLNGVISTALYWNFCRWRPKLIFEMSSFKRIFSFGSNIMIAGVVATMVNNLYVVIIGRYYNTITVGYFTHASQATNMLSGVLSSTLQNVTYPLLSSINDDADELKNTYKKVIKITMLFSLPVMSGFASVSDLFTIIFLGDSWVPMIPILLSLSLARILTPINAINMNILNVIGRSDLYLKVDLLKLPVTLVTLIIAIPYGIMGISLAIVVSSIFAFFINTYYPGRLFNLGLIVQLKITYKYVISSLVMYVSTTQINNENLILEFILKILIGIIVYVCTLFLLKAELSTLFK